MRPRKDKDRLLGFFGDRFHKNVFLFCVLISAGLIIASFVTPPMWIIDGSILAAVGELFAFAALGEVAAAIERGHSASISHGNTTIEIKKEDEDTPVKEEETEDAEIPEVL